MQIALISWFSILNNFHLVVWVFYRIYDICAYCLNILYSAKTACAVLQHCKHSQREGRGGKVNSARQRSERSECLSQGQSVVLLWICLPGHDLPGGQRGGHRTSRQCWQGVDNKHRVRTGHLQDSRPQYRLRILYLIFGVSWVGLSACLCVFSQRYPQLSTQNPALYPKTGT